jgi:hypothetical protein
MAKGLDFLIILVPPFYSVHVNCTERSMNFMASQKIEQIVAVTTETGYKYYWENNLLTPLRCV